MAALSPAYPRWQTIALVCLALLAFAGNSLFARAALRDTDIDAGSFTLIRLLAGALTLLYLMWLRLPKVSLSGSWRGAWALVIYAVCFSLAYRHIDAGIGALFLFGSVQLSMLGWGLWRGERLSLWQWLGVALAAGGLIYLAWPRTSAITLTPSSVLLMVIAGIAWGAYSLLGRGSGSPLANTASNFIRALPLAIIMVLPLWYFELGVAFTPFDSAGAAYAVGSGALTSAVGYAIWYRALPLISAAQAATVQLSVPVITAWLGVLWLQEQLNYLLVSVALISLSGIALMMFAKPKAN